MPILHLIYVLICSLAFAAMDLLRKLLAGRVTPIALVFFVAIGAVPAMTVWMALAGKYEISVGYVVPGVGSLVLNFLANLGFVYSVKFSPLSRTIPFLSLTPVFTSLLAIPLLSEYPSLLQWVGIVGVVGGALVLNLDRAFEGSAKALLGAIVHEKGSILMMGVALLWSLTVPLDKMAISNSSSPVHGLILSLGVAVGALALLLGQDRLGDLGAFKQSRVLVLTMMICASLALAFQFLSIQVVLVSLVETFKRAIGSFMAVFLGWLVFKESVTLHKVIAISAMAAGVALILK